MNVHNIPYEKTGYFSPLILDYLKQHPALSSFYTAFPTVQALQAQALEKTSSFSASKRKVLQTTLRQQYDQLSISDATYTNINRLQEDKTVTITTGHQLCLMTGPLFFIYKIVQTVKLCDQLNAADTSHHYVPVYWMASEDHDFEEISSFLFAGKKFKWTHPEQGGAVGSLDLNSLQAVLSLFEAQLPTSHAAEQLKKLIEISYRESENLAMATRKLVNALFGEYGLVIVDGHAPELKQQFVPIMEDELRQSSCQTAVQQQIDTLQKNYSDSYRPQVSPRDINLFYLSTTTRKRIIRHPQGYQLDGASDVITSQQLIDELHTHPERFSPNVLLRPLYQEVILPNIAYIGGGGELAYWLELRAYFKSQQTTFPLLILRNSAVLSTAKTIKKISNFGLHPEDFFLRRTPLINKKIRQISNVDLDLQFLKKTLSENFTYLEKLTQQTDASFLGAVAAQRQKQFNGIDHLEKRLLQAQKKKLKDQVERLTQLYESLFPEENLQERQLNFTTFYLEYGIHFIPNLMQAFDPLGQNLVWIDG